MRMQLRYLVLGVIRLYQRTLSPDHGLFKALYSRGFCRYNPSCSQYAYEAILHYGVIRGGFKALYRILRCQPWSKGGNDPVK